MSDREIEVMEEWIQKHGFSDKEVDALVKYVLRGEK